MTLAFSSNHAFAFCPKMTPHLLLCSTRPPTIQSKPRVPHHDGVGLLWCGQLVTAMVAPIQGVTAMVAQDYCGGAAMVYGHGGLNSSGGAKRVAIELWEGASPPATWRRIGRVGPSIGVSCGDLTCGQPYLYWWWHWTNPSPWTCGGADGLVALLGHHFGG